MGQIHQDAIVAVYKLLLNTVLYLGGMPKILTTSRKYYSIYNNMLRDTDDYSANELMCSKEINLNKM